MMKGNGSKVVQAKRRRLTVSTGLLKIMVCWTSLVLVRSIYGSKLMAQQRAD